MEETLLCTECLLYSQTDPICATLTNASISLKRGKKKDPAEEIISINDIVGCHVAKGNKTTAARWYLCLFFYPLCKKKVKGLIRKRCVRSLGIISSSNDEENKKEAKKWKTVIKHLIAGKHVHSSEVNDLPTPATKNFIVYINPFGGRGKANQIYEKRVKAMFAEAEIQHEVVKTEYAGHGKEMAKQLNIHDYDGIVVVSGDGLIHEIINGLMEREDWETAIRIPIGAVPGGSGNALAAAIVYASTGAVRSNDIALDCLFEIVRGRTRDLSLVYAQVDDKNFYSFLNFGWGFMADVDIESEKYRNLGIFRFTVGCVVRLVNLRKYRGRVSFLPATDHNLDQLPTAVQSRIVRNNSSLESRAGSILDNPSSVLLTTSNRDDVMGTSFASRNKKSSDVSPDLHRSGKDVIPSQAVPLMTPEPLGDGVRKKPFYLHANATDTISSNWQSIEDDFVWISSVYLSHLGEDIFMMPCAELDEEVMYLYCIKSTMSKMNFLRLLLSVDKGKHLEISPQDVFVLPCKAFQLEPISAHTGYMTSDGERIPHKPLQASVTNVKARVMCSVVPE